MIGSPRPLVPLQFMGKEGMIVQAVTLVLMHVMMFGLWLNMADSTIGGQWVILERFALLDGTFPQQRSSVYLGSPLF